METKNFLTEPSSSYTDTTPGLRTANDATLSEFFDVEFIAYGGASTHGNAEDGYTFECQHGPRECAGHIVQGCTVHHVSDMMMQVELLNCMSAASKPEEAGEV